MTDRTLLVVDDDIAAMKTLVHYLRNGDYRIIQADSTDKAFELLQAYNVNVVVSDYRMPDMDGLEFLRIVKETWPMTVRILISGYVDINMIIDSFNNEIIYKFIPKPWVEYDIKKMIDKSFSHYFLMESLRQ